MTAPEYAALSPEDQQAATDATLAEVSRLVWQGLRNLAAYLAAGHVQTCRECKGEITSLGDLKFHAHSERPAYLRTAREEAEEVA